MCALPSCHRRLTPDSDSGNPINIGEAAHIAGENDGKGKARRSARFDPTMTDAERNDYKNLIYVCSACHTLIDTIPEGERDYPTPRLLEIKSSHENAVRRAIVAAFDEIGFVELHEATLWACSIQPAALQGDYSLLKVEDKIKRNALSSDSRSVIAMGLGVAGSVSRYIASVAQTDTDFPERLKAGFLEEYWRLRKSGFTGDSLFEMMCAFSQRGFRTYAQRSAGIAVLVHLFEACEVFEK